MLKGLHNDCSTLVAQPSWLIQVLGHTCYACQVTARHSCQCGS